jgi:hypothetical protein
MAVAGEMELAALKTAKIIPETSDMVVANGLDSGLAFLFQSCFLGLAVASVSAELRRNALRETQPTKLIQ